MNREEIANNIKDLVYDMYQAGYADGNNMNLIDEAYQEGLNDAWECAKKLTLMISDGGFSNKTMKEIFGAASYYSIFNNMPISVVVTKIKDYEEKQKQTDAKINVGDEVIVNDIDRKAIVIGISTLEGWAEPYNILFENGNTDWVIRSAISKTGKHYDAIEEVMKELRGDEG